VTEADLLEKESVVAEYRCGALRARVWGDRVSLESGGVWLMDGLVRGMDGQCFR